jgi:hypothetical protein
MRLGGTPDQFLVYRFLTTEPKDVVGSWITWAFSDSRYLALAPCEKVGPTLAASLR